MITFYNDESRPDKILNLNYVADFNGAPFWASNLADGSNNTNVLRELEVERSISVDSGEVKFNVKFDKDDEYLAELMKCSDVAFALAVFEDEDNVNATTAIYLDSNGNITDNAEDASFTWQALSTASEPAASEPTSSEPASEPVSEPTSSAPESSETSKPSEEKPNPTTGVGSIAFAVAAAAIAGSAVIVARRKK